MNAHAFLEGLIDRFLLWRAERRRLAHERWKRRNRVVLPKPDPRSIVPNSRRPL